MATIIATVTLVVIVSWAVRHLWRSRQSGPACVGCPLAVACPSQGPPVRVLFRRPADLVGHAHGEG